MNLWLSCPEPVPTAMSFALSLKPPDNSIFSPESPIPFSTINNLLIYRHHHVCRNRGHKIYPPPLLTSPTPHYCYLQFVVISPSDCSSHRTCGVVSVALSYHKALWVSALVPFPPPTHPAAEHTQYSTVQYCFRVRQPPASNSLLDFPCLVRLKSFSPASALLHWLLQLGGIADGGVHRSTVGV